MSEQLMDTEGVAAYLNVPLRTLYYWRVRGDGPPGYRVGKHVRFRRKEVDAWLDQHADVATEPAT